MAAAMAHARHATASATVVLGADEIDDLERRRESMSALRGLRRSVIRGSRNGHPDCQPIGLICSGLDKGNTEADPSLRSG